MRVTFWGDGACTATIISDSGRTIACVTGDVSADAGLVAAVRGVDLLIYRTRGAELRTGSVREASWEAVLRLKEQAGVKLLALASDDLDRSQAELDALSEAAARLSSNVFFARQGLSFRL